MLCEKCKNREATTHYVETVNGVKKELHLCGECAKEEGLGGIGFSLPNIFSGLFGEEYYPQLKKEKSCPVCGMTLSRFSKTGMLGCPECYNTFEKELRPMILKIQKGENHKGKLPNSVPPKKKTLETLREELKAAIEKEDFEKAAILRDRIKEEEHGNE